MVRRMTFISRSQSPTETGDRVNGMLPFVLTLGLLVGVHEAGHLLASLVCRVRIHEIGLGLPPRLARIGSWRGAALTLNLLPLGGFILPAGEFDRTQEDGFAAAVARRRAAILVGGPGANILLAYLLFILAFMFGAPDRVRIVSVDAGSPASQAGLRAGDIVTRVDGQRVKTPDELRATVRANLGRTLQLAVQRGEQQSQLRLTPRLGWSASGRAAGFVSTGEIVRYPFGAAAARATQPVADMLAVVLGIGRGTSDPGLRLVGIIGMKRVSDRALQNAIDWGEPFPVLFVAASLSLALGITNLLPVPGLDGGRLMLLAPELLLRRRISDRLERRLNATGVFALLGLMLLLALRDLSGPLL